MAQEGRRIARSHLQIGESNMQKYQLYVSRLALVSALAVQSGLMASAQEGGAEPDATLRQNTVIVTSQKREEAITDVPVSLQAFTGDQLEQSGQRDISDIIRTIPGASEGLSNSEGRKVYQIRGIATLSGDSTVGYYVDDASFSLPNNQYAPLGRTFDVERVEVLRGPQGTLYGQGSMGGTIRFITADPDLRAFEGKARVGGSTTDGGEPSYYGDAAISVPLIEDKLGVRLVAGQEKKGGFVDISQFVPGEDVNDAEITNLRAKVLYKPSDAVTLRGLYQKTKADQDFSGLYDQADPPTITSSGRTSFTNNEMEQVSGFVSVDLGFASLENSIGNIDYTVDQDIELPLRLLGPGAAPVPVPVIRTSDASTFSNELRLVSNGGGGVQWVVGAYYQDSSLGGESLIPGLVPANAARIDSKSISVFGEVSWSLMDGRLTPLVGLRYFTDDRHFVDDSSTQGVPADDTAVSDTFETVNPRFNLAYTPNANDLYYLNVAKGFRSGNFNTSSVVAFGQSLGLPVGSAIKPDELWSYEVGTKLVRANGNFIFEGAVYYSDWKDIQTLVNPGLAIGLNAGRAEIYGLDYSFSVIAAEGLTLALSGNLNSAEFKNIPDGIANAVAGDLFENGQRLPFVPAYNLTASADYEWPVGTSGMSGIARASYSQTAGQFANEIKGGEQNILSARLGVKKGAWSAVLFGDNLLGESDPIYNQSSPLLSTQTRVYPTQVGLELSVDF
jgi:iron complex outermembrane receptor protein